MAIDIGAGYPGEIFVKLEDAHTSTPYLIADENADNIGAEDCVVGVYRLVRTGMVNVSKTVTVD